MKGDRRAGAAGGRTGERFGERSLDSIAAALAGIDRRVLRGGRRAAVVIPLCHVGGAPSVLFTRRSESVPTHKGQVAFPGGMAHPGDESLVETAIRELEEEVGHPRQAVRVLGIYHDSRAITGVPVTPVVGYLGELGDLGSLVPCDREIDTIFTLTLDQLRDPDAVETVRVPLRGTYPIYKAGPFPVWGLTALILDAFMKDILDAP
jgi:nudix motif 8